MRKLQILIPMAGAGSRFANAGFTTPKPLIDVDGMAMFLKAISSIEQIPAEKEFLFVIRQEHVLTQKLDKLIKKALKTAKVIVIPELTRGAAETALAAKEYLDKEAGLIVMDCDLWFNSKSYNKMVEESLSDTAEHHGGLLTFEADNPRYSYAKFDKNHIVTQTAEKVVISNHAITGAYFFSTAKEFIQAAEKLLQQPLTEKMPEYYISFLYNIIINEGKKIKAAFVDEFASFGTPEELEAYQASKTA